MGAFLMVEAGSEAGRLMTRLPTKGGKAVLNFLLALSWFCNSDESIDTDLDKKSREWFKHLQTQIQQPLCDVFKPILDSIGADDGEFYPDFLEDEYAWYVKRNPNPIMSEIEFRKSVIEAMKHWSSIDLVMENVELINNLLNVKELTEVEGPYSSEQVIEDLIPGFQSLYDTLVILKKFYFEVIRLAFY